MKYLKYFESNFKDSDIYNDIKDIFQDIIDEYDMEETFKWDIESIQTGYSYRIEESGITRMGQGSSARIIIWFDMALPPEERRELVKRTLLNSKRLNSIGYDTRLDTTNKNGIELSDFKSSRSYDALDNDWLDEWIELQVSHANISESKLKSNLDYHIEMIKDVFQEIVDDYDIDKALPVGYRSPGIYYSFLSFRKRDGSHYAFLNPKDAKYIKKSGDGGFIVGVNYIRIDIEICDGFNGEDEYEYDYDEFLNKFKLILEDLKGFKSRLNNMGYDVYYDDNFQNVENSFLSEESFEIIIVPVRA